MSEALVRQDLSARTIGFTDDAMRAREDALEACALVSVVRNPNENERAQLAFRLVGDFLAKCEAARVAAKLPALQECRNIDAAVARFISEAATENVRLGKAIGDFLTLEAAKQRDAEIARRRDIEEIERKKREELAAVKSHEQREAVQARFDGLAAAVPAPPPLVRAEGQTARPVWEVEIENIDILYRHYPHCVKLEPRMSEIYAQLERLPEGQMLPGVKAEKVIKPGRTAKRERKAIEIGGTK